LGTAIITSSEQRILSLANHNTTSWFRILVFWGFFCAQILWTSDVTANEKQNVGPVCSVHHPSHPHSGPGPDFSSMALVLVFVVVALPQRAATSDEADDGARSRVINYYSVDALWLSKAAGTQASFEP
jgi:hypothetical protein